MKIRKATKKDLPQLTILCWENHKEMSKFTDDVVVNKKTKEGIKKEMSFTTKNVFTETLVAEENGKIIGNIDVHFTPGLRKEGSLYNLFVIKSKRGRGIGSELMNEGINLLKQKEIKSIRMIVHRKNINALSFLRKFNFKKEPIKVFWLRKLV